MTSNQDTNDMVALRRVEAERQRVRRELVLLEQVRTNIELRDGEIQAIGRETAQGNLWTKNHLLSYIFSTALTEIQRQLLFSYFPSYHSYNCKILAILVGLISLPFENAEEQRSPIETWSVRLSKFKDALRENNNRWNVFAYDYYGYLHLLPENRDRPENRPHGNPPHPLQNDYHSVYLDGWNFVREHNRGPGTDDRSALQQIGGVVNMRLRETRDRQRHLYNFDLNIREQLTGPQPPTGEEQQAVWDKIAGAPDPDDLPDCYLCLETIITTKPTIKPFNCSHPICLDCAKNHLQVDNRGRFPSSVNKCGVCRESTSGFNRRHFTATLNAFAEFY